MYSSGFSPSSTLSSKVQVDGGSCVAACDPDPDGQAIIEAAHSALKRVTTRKRLVIEVSASRPARCRPIPPAFASRHTFGWRRRSLASDLPARPEATFMRRLFALAAAALLAGCTSGGSTTSSQAGSGGPSFAMVTDVGGLGDKSFNDSANRGLQRSEERRVG